MSCSIANPNETRTAIYVDGVADYASKVYDIEPGKSKYDPCRQIRTVKLGRF